MRVKPLCFLLFLLFFNSTFLYSQRLEDTGNSRYFSNLDFFYNEIKNYYVNLEMKENKLNFDWDKLYIKYKLEMSGAVTEADFYRIISSFNSELKDVNSMVAYKGRASRVNIFKFSEGLYRPLNCRIIEDKVLIVNSTLKPNVAGKYIVSINDVSIDEILDKLEKVYSIHGTEKGTRHELVNRNRFIEYFQLFRKQFPDTLEYKLKDFYSGEISYVKMSKSANYRAPLSSQKPHIYLGFHYSDIFPQSEILSGNTGYLRIPSFKANKDAVIKGFEKEIKKLENAQVKNVIIDLRWSNGENESLQELLSFFITKPYTPFYFRFKDSFRFNDVMKNRSSYEDRRYAKSSKKPESGYTGWWKIAVEPAINQFLTKVNIVVLTNSVTSGEASLFAYEISRTGNSIIIGDDFSLSGHGLATPVLFPDKLYYTRYSYRETFDSEFRLIENKKVKPTIISEQTIDDYKKGIDTEIKAALKYLKNKK